MTMLMHGHWKNSNTVNRKPVAADEERRLRSGAKRPQNLSTRYICHTELYDFTSASRPIAAFVPRQRLQGFRGSEVQVTFRF